MYRKIVRTPKEALKAYRKEYPDISVWIERNCGDYAELGSENPEHDCVILYYTQFVPVEKDSSECEKELNG